MTERSRRNETLLNEVVAASRYRSSHVVAQDCFGLEEFLEAPFAELAAVTGLFVTAERRGLIDASAIDVDVARANLTCDAACALDVFRLHVTRQAIERVIGDPHGVRIVGVAND